MHIFHERIENRIIRIIIKFRAKTYFHESHNATAKSCQLTLLTHLTTLVNTVSHNKTANVIFSLIFQVMTSASPSADSLTDTTNSSFATPPFSLSPVGESQGFSRWRSSGSFEEQGVYELNLPDIVPLELPEPRVLVIQRQPPPRSDFGFSLRRAVVVERMPTGSTQMRSVTFAEPGTIVQNVNDTGLLPGDRLIEVNGINVDDKSREEIIDLIKGSSGSVTVKVCQFYMK